MKKFILGSLALIGAILTANSLLVGCGSTNSGTAPVTVTEQPAPCAGTFGFAYQNGDNGLFNGDILAEGVTVIASAPVTARDLGLYILSTGSSAGEVRGALYAGTVSGPTTLISQSAPQSVVFDAWNDVPLPPTTLSPGFYWLAFMTQNTTYCASDLSSTSGDAFVTTSAVSFASFPSPTMPAGSTGNNPFNFYLNTCP